MSKANEDKFHNLLGNLDWENLNDETLDPHQSTLFFDTKIKNLFNTCFPIKTKLITTKLLNSPWLSSALLKSIKNKHVLYRRLTRRAFMLAALINFKNFYNNYCNMLKNLIRTSKKKHFDDKFNQCKNDVRKTWDLINTTLRPGRRNKNATHKLVLNNNTLTKPLEIAQAFNNHFSSIGNRLRNAIPRDNMPNFKNFLPPSNRHSIYLSPSTPHEVSSLIKKLKNKKSNLHTPSVKLFKLNADFLSIPISIIFNSSISMGTYPDLLKIACVTVLFKAGDKFNMNNYRPISCLSLLIKYLKNSFMLGLTLSSILTAYSLEINMALGEVSARVTLSMTYSLTSTSQCMKINTWEQFSLTLAKPLTQSPMTFS